MGTVESGPSPAATQLRHDGRGGVEGGHVTSLGHLEAAAPRRIKIYCKASRYKTRGKTTKNLNDPEIVTIISLDRETHTADC